MSNGIRYDSLLVRYLGEELERRLGGRRIEALSFDPRARTAAIAFDGEGLLLRLHPSAGAVLLAPAPALQEAVPLPGRAALRSVTVPPDERCLILDLASPRPRPDRTGRIVVELLGNQWNVVAVDPAERIVAVLRRRTAGGRRLLPGVRYEPPAPTARRGRDGPLGREDWMDLLAGVPPAERARALVSAVAYTSPVNAAAILGPAADTAADAELEAAYERYAALASLPEASPRVLQTERGPQPYPLPLPGIPAERHPTLLDAMAAAAGVEPPPAAPRIPQALLDRLRGRVERIDRRRERLAAELAGAGPESARLRHRADLLLSHLHAVRKGQTRVELPDFEGGTVEVALDPALTPTENARRLYDAAKKRERAAERLPRLIERSDAERERLAALLARAEAGRADAQEVEAAVGAAPEGGGRGGPRAEAVLPYRRYRTTGGLEVRVGRGRKANDDLTFHHSSPNDVWLHARDAAGAHVVLRWSDANANPPARDLAEAAVLAALNSKARTSGTVAVDWTRRKYVRKPRKAPPGLVAIDRARTVFVEPDPALERRLRA